MKVVSFYRFLDLGDTEVFRARLQSLCDKQGLLGTVLVASEGLNGTLAGEQLAIKTVFSWIARELALSKGCWTLTRALSASARMLV